jgi:hypothetical protein
MKQQKPAILTSRHKAVYHAALGCQAASLSLTSQCLRGVKEACPIERQKTGCCFASEMEQRLMWRGESWVCRSVRMEALSCFKGGALVGFLLAPHGKEHAHPHICQRANGHTVAFPLLPFAFIVVLGPRFLLRTRPAQTGARRCAAV